MKKCSISLTIKKVHIEITLRFHLTAARMGSPGKQKQNKTNKQNKQQMLARMWGKKK
jgi:hypothetical protein